MQDTKDRNIGYDSCSQEILNLVRENASKCLNTTQFGNAVAGHSLGTLGGQQAPVPREFTASIHRSLSWGRRGKKGNVGIINSIYKGAEA